MTKLRDQFAVTHEKGGYTYISWSQAADRLDDSGEPWSFAILQLGPDWCHGRLTIGDRHYENIGYAENAEADWKKEPYKDAVSDAFKRCAALAGVARYLYDKDIPTGSGRAPSPSARPSAPLRVVVEEDPTRDAPAPWEASTGRTDDGGTCPDHGQPWTLKPAGVSKAGREYDAFWKCDGKYDDGSFCKQKPPKAWAARHEQ